MISSNWNRFQWKTSALPSSPQLKEPFRVRIASSEEQDAARKVALLSMTMSTDWHDASSAAHTLIQEGVKKAFSEEGGPSCLVITHGSRIVGVSMLDLDLEATNHLVSGPWVLAEYRNRGFATALLWASLQKLADHGVVVAYGITRKNSNAAQFIYSKFDGEMISCSSPLEQEVIS